MAELQVYDSQGLPIRDGPGGENQQVSDFFFDGVRLAIDANRNEMFCFFRARDNNTARSEQYYAKYTYQTRSEMGGIYDALKKRIEGEYGMLLDTENDDTRFFELLGSSESGRVPETSDLNDVGELLSNYESARIGVGSYSEAYGLFRQLFSNSGVNKIAVSDNATGRSLSAYDLVIEKGDYYGVELLGDTEEKVESLREQRRAAFESEYGTDDDNDSISGLMGAALFGGIGVVLILAVVYGSCLGLGMAVPGVGDPPGVNSCGPSLGSVSADVAGDGTQEIWITGAIKGINDANATINVTVAHENGTEPLNSSGTRRVNSSGNFNFTVQPNENVTMTPGNYTASIKYGDKSKNASFTVGNEVSENSTTSSKPANESTPSPSGSNDNTSSTSGNDDEATTSTEESTTGGSIDSISAQDTVNGRTSSFAIRGTASNLTSQTVELTVDFSSADGTPLNSVESKNVTIEANGEFSFTVPFEPADIQGPYEVTVTYNDSTHSDMFESENSTAPQLEDVTVFSVDPENAKISFKGNTSNINWGTNPTVEVRVDNTTSTVHKNEPVAVTTEDDGTFRKIGLTVSNSSLPDGNYTLGVTYDGMQVEDMFSIPFSD